jgi:energy-coupling factor transport system ATP-binding protein
MPRKTVCELRDVTFVYPGGAAGGSGCASPALRNVTLSIYEGEWVALLGSNGSGKSTLAKHLNALLVPSQGDCLVYGLSTRDEKNVFPIRSTVAMVFQNPENQIVGTVVEEDAAFGPENQGVPPDEIVQRVEVALAVAGLLEKRKKPTYTLSGGEKQRLAVAGALAMDTPCLVLDEPTAMLDPAGRGTPPGTPEPSRLRQDHRLHHPPAGGDSFLRPGDYPSQGRDCMGGNRFRPFSLRPSLQRVGARHTPSCVLLA